MTEARQPAEQPVNRIERLLDVLAQATLGNYDARIADLDDSEDDDFLEIEVGTNMLLDELSEARLRNAEQIKMLDRQSEQLQQKQAELVRVLSTPIIIVAPGVLALPIIGTVESERAQNMTEALLERVMSERASHVILDLTGASDIAAATARSLVRMAQALRLLGSRCILTGISPHVAKTLITLSFDISDVQSLPQLADALALVLAEKTQKKSRTDRALANHAPQEKDSHADSSGRK